MAEQQRVEHALAGEGAEVAREHRVGDFEPGRRAREPCAEDEPVALVGEVARQRERLLGQAREPVAHLGGERGEQREPDRHVGDHGGCQRRVEPVHHPHRGPGHDHRAPHGDEQQDPLGVVLPRPAEGGAEQDPGGPRYTASPDFSYCPGFPVLTRCAVGLWPVGVFGASWFTRRLAVWSVRRCFRVVAGKGEGSRFTPRRRIIGRGRCGTRSGTGGSTPWRS